MRNFLLLIALLSSTLMAKDTQLFCSDPSPYIVQDKTQKSHYKECKRNGMTYWFKDDGSIKSEVNFIDGKENGLYTSYYANGKRKIVVNYTNAQKDGPQTIYYDNGVVGSTVFYNNGRREGIMTDFDIDGYKSAEVYYKNNYKVGLKKYYDKKGNIINTEMYEMDRNPVVVQMLKDKRKEVLVDLAKYGLMPEDAPKEMRFR